MKRKSAYTTLALLVFGTSFFAIAQNIEVGGVDMDAESRAELQEARLAKMQQQQKVERDLAQVLKFFERGSLFAETPSEQDQIDKAIQVAKVLAKRQYEVIEAKPIIPAKIKRDVLMRRLSEAQDHLERITNAGSLDQTSIDAAQAIVNSAQAALDAHNAAHPPE